MSLKHGLCESPEYAAWKGIKRRCLNPNSKNWKYYGERGIKVCKRWKDSFEAFWSDMGKRPSSKHSIDRIDNNGNYEPSNCRWATRSEQRDNTRFNRFICFQGITRTVGRWEKHFGLGKSVLRNRLGLGWTVEKALSQPKRRKRKNNFCQST